MSARLTFSPSWLNFAETRSSERVRIPNARHRSALKRTDDRTLSYVENLETRVEKLQALLHRVSQSALPTRGREIASCIPATLLWWNDNWGTDSSQALWIRNYTLWCIIFLRKSHVLTRALFVLQIVPGADFTKDLDSAEFQLAKGSVADHAAVLIRRSAEGLEGYTGGEHDSILLPDTMNARHDLDGNLRFFGKSSGAMFVKQALDLKMQYTGSAPIMTKTSLGTARPEFWHTQPVCLSSSLSNHRVAH